MKFFYHFFYFKRGIKRTVIYSVNTSNLYLHRFNYFKQLSL
jgi:hypothetical protein